jgi:hypothetical protein
MNFAIFGIGSMATGEGVRVWFLLLEYVEKMDGMLIKGSLPEGIRGTTEGCKRPAPAVGIA